MYISSLNSFRLNNIKLMVIDMGKKIDSSVKFSDFQSAEKMMNTMNKMREDVRKETAKAIFKEFEERFTCGCDNLECYRLPNSDNSEFTKLKIKWCK